MTRLSALDGSFLRLETASAHMHVGWLAFLDEPFDVDALRGRLGQKLPLVPRFTQRLRPAPLGLTEPSWVRDQEFDLDRHLHVIEEELTVDEVDAACGEFLGVQLDRRRPLWELVLVPRVAGGGSALLGKVHHAMVDGLAAVEFGVLLFDTEADPPPLDAPAPPPRSLERRRAMDGAVEQFARAGSVARMGLSPRSGLRVADSVRRAAFSLAEDALSPAPRSYLNGTLGPERVLIHSRLEMERLLAVKSFARAKLNDVVLAVVAGALRRLAAIAEEECRPLRAMVPVSVRGDGDGAGGNRISFAFVDLPVDEAAAVRRLQRVQTQTGQLKADGVGGDLLLKALSPMPGPVKDAAARLVASPRLYNLVVSNVPGPRMDLFAGGARVRAIHPVIPLSDEHLLSVGVVTYGGGANFGIYGDPAALPEEVGEFPVLLEQSLAQLEGALKLRPRRRARGGRAPASRKQPAR